MDILRKENDEHLIIRKPNELIRLVGDIAVTKLNLIAYNYILHRMQKENSNIIVLTLADIFKDTGLVEDYTSLTGFLESLLKISIISSDARGKTWGGFNLLSAFKKYGKNGYIIEIPSLVFDALCRKDKLYYTTIKILEERAFKNPYSIIFYEIFKQYEGIAIPEIALEDLKEITHTENRYKMYSDFKRHVLEKVLKELNGYDLKYNFTYTEKKIGKKVIAIKFKANKKRGGLSIEDTKPKKRDITSEISVSLNIALKKALKNRYVNKAFSEKSFIEILNKYNEKDMIRALGEIYDYNKEIINFKSFLIAKIEDITNTEVIKNQSKEIQPITIKKGLSEEDYQEYLENEKKMSDSLPLKKTENFQNISISKKEETLTKKYANQLISEVNTISSQEEIEIIDIRELKNVASERFHEMNEEILTKKEKREKLMAIMEVEIGDLQGEIINKITLMNISQSEKTDLKSQLVKINNLEELYKFEESLMKKL